MVKNRLTQHWRAAKLGALLALSGGTAGATSVDPTVWSPRGIRDFAVQGRAVADLAIGGVVLASGPQRRNRDGHKYVLWCWNVEVQRVFLADRVVDPVIDICVYSEQGGVPAEFAEVQRGDLLRVFLVEAADGTLRPVADRAIMRFRDGGRSATCPDFDVEDGSAVDRELEND